MFGLIIFIALHVISSDEIIFKKIGATFKETKTHFLTKNTEIKSTIYDSINFKVSKWLKINLNLTCFFQFGNDADKTIMKVQSLLQNIIHNANLDIDYHNNLTSQVYTCYDSIPQCPSGFEISKNRKFF